MRVTFWGVRGSVPTPGPRTVRYGGNTSTIEVRVADGTSILLDGGTGLRELGRTHVQEPTLPSYHLVVTHVHWDHLLGVPFFAPLYRPGARIVFHPAGGDRSILYGPEQLFDGRRFPLRLHQLPAEIERAKVEGPLEARTIGSARLTGIRLNHPGGATGYRIDDADGSSMVLYTDNELPPGGDHIEPPIVMKDLQDFARGAGLLVHDSQYIEQDMPLKLGWGHSIIPSVLELGRTSEVHTLALYHHDPERDDDQLDAIGSSSALWWKDHVGAGQVVVAREGLSLEVTRDGAREA